MRETTGICKTAFGAMALAAFSAPFLACGAATAADEPPQALVEEVRQWAHAPTALVTLRGVNELREGWSRSRILEMDGKWRDQRDAEDQPLVARVLGNPLSRHLTRVQAHSLGLYVELFVTGAHGLNAGQSAVTSDFWQGDEGKFKEPWSEGADGFWVGDAEPGPHGITKRQFALTVVDPKTGDPLGVAVAEYDVDKAHARYGADN